MDHPRAPLCIRKYLFEGLLPGLLATGLEVDFWIVWQLGAQPSEELQNRLHSSSIILHCDQQYTGALVSLGPGHRFDYIPSLRTAVSL